MATVLAFDIYGTLIDTHGVVTRLREFVGDRAEDFSRVWREKQLEYSFRRGLMRAYENFGVCTSQSLDYTSAYLDLPLTPDQKAALLAEYRVLPAFADVKGSLVGLKGGGVSLYAFSNGTADAVETLLENAGIRSLFDGVVSVDDRQTFKPDPDVYQHLLDAVALHRVADRPDRFEPRFRKRKFKKYIEMHVPRNEAKAAMLKARFKK